VKNILTILFLTLINIVYCSEKDTLKYNFSNDFGYLYSNSHSISYIGDNVLSKKKYQFSLHTSYSYSNTNSQVDQNEFLNKTSFSYNGFFINHIANISYRRKIRNENFSGVGYVYKFKKQPMSLSYAVLGQYRQYYYDSIEYKIRHSLRFKLKFKLKFVNISLECYYQPNFLKMNDYIIYGHSKIIFFEQKRLSLSLSENINYQSVSSIKMVHSFSIGVGFNLEKK
jgi:hypothetical protein